MTNLTVEQIVDIDWYKNHQGVPQRVIIQAFETLRSIPNVRMFLSGNTILVVHLTTKEFHFINADSFNDFVRNVNDLFAQCGEKELNTYFTNPLIIEVAKQTGVDFDVSKTNDEYLMTVRL